MCDICCKRITSEQRPNPDYVSFNKNNRPQVTYTSTLARLHPVAPVYTRLSDEQMISRPSRFSSYFGYAFDNANYDNNNNNDDDNNKNNDKNSNDKSSLSLSSFHHYFCHCHCYCHHRYLKTHIAFWMSQSRDISPTLANVPNRNGRPSGGWFNIKMLV